jgi:hypothetical protein
MTGKRPLVPYIDQLMAEVDAIEAEYVAVLDASAIVNVHPSSGGANQGIAFFGYAHWGWAPSDEAQQVSRMTLLGRVWSFRPRFLLLFPHPTPEVEKRHEQALQLLEQWLSRSNSDRSIPSAIPQAIDALRQAIATLRKAADLLPEELFTTHLVVDTNVLLDNPDLARFTEQVGRRYLVHLLPVVLRELDEHKRAGRNQDLRDAARRADRRLKGLRDNGDVAVGVKVAGDVWAVFEHIEPRVDGLPLWLDLSVPDDRLVASALLLVSRHPAATNAIVTGDLNLQTKLAAVQIPYLDPDE